MYKFKNSNEIKKSIGKIENLILSKKLKPHDIINEIDTLSKEFEVKQSSLEKAFKILEISGLIEIRNDDVFLAERYYPDLLNPVSIAFILDGGTSYQVFETRKFIECHSASLAAERRTDIDIEILKTIIDRMRLYKDTNSDKDFHFIISKMTHNKLLYYQTMSMVNLTNVFIDNSFNSFIEEYTFDVVHKIHHDIYEAIKKQNSQEAYNAMKRHFGLLEKFYK
jgi:DNA-binding FadR family transcriptional regulator